MQLNWNKIGKWTAVLTPVILAGVYYIYKKGKDKEIGYGEKKYQDVIDETKGITKSTLSNCKFPLKVGSRNECVKELQYALGIKPDGIFGSKETLPALKNKTGKTQILNDAELRQIIDSIKKSEVAVSEYSVNKNAALKVNELFNKDEYSNILFLKDTTLYQVIKDLNGDFVRNGYVINMKANRTLSLNDYIPQYQFSKNGNLILNVSKVGTNTGNWEINANNITLK